MQGISLQLHVTIRKGQEGLTLSEIRIIILRRTENNFSLYVFAQTSFRTTKHGDSRDKVAVRRLQQSSESCLAPNFFSPQLPPRLNSPSQP